MMRFTWEHSVSLYTNSVCGRPRGALAGTGDAGYARLQGDVLCKEFDWLDHYRRR